MWDRVLQKLEQLKEIDRQYQAFGAWDHRYSLRPCLSESEVAGVEHTLGVSLPNALRVFYLEVGDGGAGPCYGLNSSAELTGFRPEVAFPGIAEFRQIAASRGRVPPDEDGYFEIPKDEIAGLLSIIPEGCGHNVCLISNGPLVGTVVRVSANGFVSNPKCTLVKLYLEWLDREITLFEAVRSLMVSAANSKQIYEEMVARFQDHKGRNRIASIADVPKPAELFGESGRHFGSGAEQFPWYDQVLKEWQRSNA